MTISTKEIVKQQIAALDRMYGWPAPEAVRLAKLFRDNQVDVGFTG